MTRSERCSVAPSLTLVTVFDEAGNEQYAPIPLTRDQVADVHASLPPGWHVEEREGT